MSDTRADRLRILHGGGGGAPLTIFCGHCGRSPEAGEVPARASRVCGRCGMGLLLQAPADAAPGPDDAFLLVDRTLAVCALSRRAEEVLGVTETEAIHRHVGEFLVPADAEAPDPRNFVALLVNAASGEQEPVAAVVRPAGTFGVRHRVRVGSCGPPTAALIVLEPGS